MFVGDLAGQPVTIIVPDGWSGQVSVVFNIHRGQPSRRYQVVKAEFIDPTQEHAPS